jgi:hypothetical protein
MKTRQPGKVEQTMINEHEGDRVNGFADRQVDEVRVREIQPHSDSN